MCDGRNHELIEVYRSSPWDCDEVVRWCQDCGAVVVDVEVDGRLMDCILPMKFPTGRK